MQRRVCTVPDYALPYRLYKKISSPTSDEIALNKMLSIIAFYVRKSAVDEAEFESVHADIQKEFVMMDMPKKHGHYVDCSYYSMEQYADNHSICACSERVWNPAAHTLQIVSKFGQSVLFWSFFDDK